MSATNRELEFPLVPVLSSYDETIKRLFVTMSSIGFAHFNFAMTVFLPSLSSAPSRFNFQVGQKVLSHLFLFLLPFFLIVLLFFLFFPWSG
jgi:hypothetical protein